MNRRNTVGTALVVLAIVLFVVPAVFPVQPMLTHDTGRSTSAPPAELRQQGVPIVAYENLTDRGQEIYVETLEANGEYRVPADEGAPAFVYPTDAERRAAFESDNMTAAGEVVIERPEDDENLPRAEEYYFPDQEGMNDTEAQQRREQAMRYDLMVTSTGQPPLGSTPQLLRLGAVMLAVVFLGVGGYLLSSKG
jgi:hypothetical protein